MVRVLLLILCLTSSAAAARAVKLSDGIDAYRAGRFSKAIEIFEAFIATLPEPDKGSAREREAREKLVLSLYASKKSDAAVSEFKALRKRFPDFGFDADRVSPDTIAFFERQAAQPAPKIERPQDQPASQTVIIAQPPPSTPASGLQPRVIEKAPNKQWHWYYLAPLGIGQFLAGSPVRGALLLVLEVGFITMNAVCFALLMPQIRSDGTVQSLERSVPLQVLTNIGFFGWISTLIYGAADGLFLEP